MVGTYTHTTQHTNEELHFLYCYPVTLKICTTILSVVPFSYGYHAESNLCVGSKIAVYTLEFMLFFRIEVLNAVYEYLLICRAVSFLNILQR